MTRLILPTLLGAMLLATAIPVQAEAPPGWEWGGSLRSLNLTGDEAPADLAPAYRLSSTRLRLESSGQPAPDWRLESALDYQLLGTDPAGFLALPGEGVNRHVDLDHHWQHDQGWAGRLQVDRFNLGWSSGRFDATIGRQATGFGRIALASPLDIIAPFPPDAIDTTVRPGVDALRGVLNYGQDGQLGAVAVFGDIDRHNSYLLTWSDNRGGIDLLAIGGELRSRPMLGLGLAGSLGNLGLKAEAATYQGTRHDQPDGDRQRHFTIAAVEGWYRFAAGLTLIGEYLYNGAGADTPDDYYQVAGSAAFREGLVALLGRHYLLLTPSIELHPLVTFNGLLIWNLGDDSALLRPTLAISLADNLALELFWTHGHGHQSKRRPLPVPPAVRSEFGNQGESGGLFLTWYF